MAIDTASDEDALAFLLLPYADGHVSRVLRDHGGFAVSPRTVENWKAGRCLPHVELLEGLAVATDLPIREIRTAYSRARFARRRATMARKAEAGPRKLKRPALDLRQAS
jgi:hypothetical protein